MRSVKNIADCRPLKSSYGYLNGHFSDNLVLEPILFEKIYFLFFLVFVMIIF